MTEENEQSSEAKEQDLAQEALDATEKETPSAEESAEKEEPTVPLHDHTALRQRAQQAEVAQARAEGKLAAIEQLQAQQQAPAKSPLQLEIERQAAEGISEEDMTVSPKIIKAQELYNQQVASQATETATRNQLAAKQLVSANKAKAGHEDWQSIVLAADGLMTEGELLDLSRAGENFGELAYTTANAAIERNKSGTETDTAPEKKQSESEAEAKAKAEAEAKAKAGKVPTQQEILKDLNVDPITEAAAQL